MSAPFAVASVRLDDLHGSTHKVRHLNANHIEQLAEAIEDLPPVLVRTRSEGGYEVIDGYHRTGAHRRLGLVEIAAQVIECDDEEALRRAIAANASHGLPLTLDEKKSNAAALVALNPDLSDREVAKICGLSPTTVGKLRPTVQGVHSGQLDKPSAGERKAAAEQKAAATEYIEEHPEATVREVAEATGVSTGTAGNVKKARSMAERWAAAVTTYPFLADIPDRYRTEAVHGAEGLDQFDATERPRREDTFRRWAESRVDAFHAEQQAALRNKAETAGGQLLDVIADVHLLLSAYLTRAADLPVGHELHAQIAGAATELARALGEVQTPKLRSVQ